MDDGLDAVHRGLEPFAGRQIAGQVADAVLVRPAAPAEHSDVVPGVPQPRDDLPPQGGPCRR